jgi:YrhK-like protein
LIGHALAFAPRPATTVAWERAIAVGFAVGSACFFIGPFPGFVQLVGSGADGVVFFAGSVFFTVAAGMELREATVRRGRRWGSDPSWWSAAIQFAGTLWFNVNTFDAMRDGLSTRQEDRLIWAPDFFGSACFLVSAVLAYRVANESRVRGARPGREWRMAAVNLAGCVLFGVSAIASYVVPSSGSILDLAAANWCTALGALCFFIGALLLLLPSHADVSTEVSTCSPSGARGRALATFGRSEQGRSNVCQDCGVDEVAGQRRSTGPRHGVLQGQRPAVLHEQRDHGGARLQQRPQLSEEVGEVTVRTALEGALGRAASGRRVQPEVEQRRHGPIRPIGPQIDRDELARVGIARDEEPVEDAQGALDLDPLERADQLALEIGVGAESVHEELPWGTRLTTGHDTVL